MKRANLREGELYKSKFGREWRTVRLVSLRTDVPRPYGGCDEEQFEVIVERPETRQQVYRRAGELRKVTP